MRIPLLHKKDIVEISIKEYCESARIRFKKCIDFDSRRKFLLDHIEKVIYWNEKLELHGSIPIKLKTHENEKHKTESAKIQFCIKDIIPKSIRFNRPQRNPYRSSRPITRKEHDQLLLEVKSKL